MKDLSKDFTESDVLQISSLVEYYNDLLRAENRKAADKEYRRGFYLGFRWACSGVVCDAIDDLTLRYEPFVVFGTKYSMPVKDGLITKTIG